MESRTQWTQWTVYRVSRLDGQLSFERVAVASYDSREAALVERNRLNAIESLRHPKSDTFFAVTGD